MDKDVTLVPPERIERSILLIHGHGDAELRRQTFMKRSKEKETSVAES